MMKRRRRKSDTALNEAQMQILQLRNQLSSAYEVFNSTADPQLLEASILEISALRSRYNCALQNFKSIHGEN